MTHFNLKRALSKPSKIKPVLNFLEFGQNSMVWSNDSFGGFGNYFPDRFGVWDCNYFGVGGKVDMVWVVLVLVDTSDNFDRVGFDRVDRVGIGMGVGYVGKVCLNHRK